MASKTIYTCWRLDVEPEYRNTVTVEQRNSLEAAKHAARILVDEWDKASRAVDTTTPLYIAVKSSRRTVKHRIVFWIQEDADPAEPYDGKELDHDN